jgi:hypothetical protein
MAPVLLVPVSFAGCGGDGSAADAKRVAALESKVQALEVQLGRPTNPAVLGFDIECPATWQALGPVADAVWTCRKQQALPDGFWPNCNVTEALVERNPNTQAPLSAAESFETSLYAPQLKTARRIADRASALDTEPAYEAIYEHELLTKPLRVIATLAVHANHVYAVSCAAPPEAFAANEAAFRQVTRSVRWKP